MVEQIGMNIYVQSNGADKAKISLDQLTKSAERLEKATGTYTDSQGRLRDSNGRFVKSNDSVNASIGKTEQEAKNATTALGALQKAFIGYVSFALVRQVVNMADTMTSLGSQIRFVTSSIEEASAVQNELYSISNRTVASLEATTNLYTRTARALQDAGKSQADFLKFTEATNNAMRIGGRNATEQASALLQLSQALGSGVLQGDEFRSIAENAPILLDLVAQELGVVRGEVKKLSSEGKITSEVVFNALTNASEQLKKDASSMQITMGQSFQVMRNSIMRVTDYALNSTGIMATLAGGVVLLADNLEFVLIPAVGLAGVALTAMFASATKAAIAFTAALAANPIGLIVVGVTAATTALYHFRNEIVLNQELGLTLGDVVGGAFDYIKETAIAGWNAISTTFSTLYESITGSIGGFELTFTDVFMAIAKVARMPANIIINAFTAAINLTVGVFNNFAEFMLVTGKTIAYYLLSPFELAINGIQILLEGLVSGLSNIPGLGDLEVNFERFSFASQFEGDVDRMKEMLVSGMGSAWEEVKGLISNDPIGDAFGSIFFGEYAQNRRDNRLKEDEEISFSGGGGNSGGGRGGTGGLDLVSAYTKKLSSLSDETAKLISLNAQLSATGYESQYNAASSLTHELQSQSSVLSKLSDAQKQILLMKAEELDAQKQINEILKLGSDYDQRLEDMEFELTLMGRSKEQIDAMRYARELENRAKLLSIGMSEENIALLNEEIQKYLELYGVLQKKRIEQENSIGQGVTQGMRNYTDSVGNMRDQFANATTDVLGHMEDFLFDFATTGKASFGDMTASILKDLSRMMIRMAMMNTIMSFFPGLGRTGSPAPVRDTGILPKGSFYDGGFTGPGGKYQEAGIVHKNEFVFSKEATQNLGVDYLNRLHNTAKMGRGYASGGLVSGAPSFSKLQNQPQKSEPINIEVIVNTEDGSVETNAGQLSSKLKREVNVIVDQRIAKHKRPGGGL
ncbi:tape measure protein [Ignatzschineria sp. LJL83]